ncbi:MAG: bifunctional riboflavin kinase/FAD synthetase [Erysipelotrichaceae bacterium]
MKIITYHQGDTPKLNNLVACIGHFDGLHLGHLQLINKVNSIKGVNNKLSSAIIMMDPDPLNFINGCETPFLTSLEDRILRCHEYNLDYFIILKFDQVMINMQPECFIHSVLEKLNVKELVCGYDFRFAAQGSGNLDMLSKQKFNLNVIQPYKIKDIKVSTTYIKQLIKEYKLKEVKQLMKHYYKVSGTVVKGRQVGRTIGFPTANLEMKDLYVNPENGVYAGYVKVKEEYYGCIINVGYNPTFNLRNTVSIEAHILEFSSDIYGEEISLYFVELLREEVAFKNTTLLIEQLNKDVESANIILKEVKLCD